MEERLREGLRLLAEEAPELGPAQSRRRGRRVGVLAAAALVLAGMGGYVVLRPGSGGGGEDAACAAVLEFAGRTYSGWGEERRVPRRGAEVGAGLIPGCDDGNGASGSADVRVHEFPGVDPRVAVLLEGDAGVYVADGGASLPEPVRLTSEYVPCAFEGSRTVTGQWVSVRSPHRVEEDGVLRPPLRIELWTSDQRLTGPDYERVTLRARSADDLVVPDPSVVDRLLWQGQDAEVVVRCDGDAFVLESITPAR